MMDKRIILQPLYHRGQESMALLYENDSLLNEVVKKLAGVRWSRTHGKGTDVVLIQKLLGHNDINTTLKYLHVTNKDILNVLSPIEDIKDLI